MPPRKRAKLSAASTPQDTASAEPVAVEKPTTNPMDDVLNDPWTDDEYTELFKAMIRWKPTGMYKHFRMISISNALSSHGYSYNASSGSHTRIPGIWAKLEALYDLEALDEREDRHAGYITPDPSSVSEDGAEEEEEESNSISWQEFALNEDEFGEMMWARRLKSDINEGRSRRRLHTSVDVHSSPEAIEGLSHTRPVTGLFSSRDGTGEEDTISPKGKGKKSTSAASTRARGRGVRSTPAEEPDEEDEEEVEEEDDGSTQAGSPPSRGGAAKGIKKNKAASSARRSMRKR